LCIGDYHAAIWNGSQPIDLGVLPGRYYSRAEAVNNSGQIVGYSSIDYTGQYAREAVLWQNGQMIELGPLVPDDPGTGHRFQADAVDINDFGEIVGWGELGWTSVSGVVWSGGMRRLFPDLIPAGFPYNLFPVAINNAGQIACYGSIPEEYYQRAFILTPRICRDFLTGDANCDGVVNNFDIDALVLALTDADSWDEGNSRCNWLCNLDVNRDGGVNNFDIDPFVSCLTSGCP
jgi:probable HAF family extracellular repeat protein